MPPTTAPSPTFRADMLGSKQKKELADTGQFTTSTGESRNAQGQNINAPLPTAPVMDASIPVASMDGANTPMQMPEMGNALEMNPAAPAIESGNAFLDEQTRAADAETAQLESRGSAQEQNIRQLFGILGTEGEARRGLEAEAGLPGLKDAQRQISSDIINQTNQLRQFDNSNVIANEQMRIDASKRDITKRTYGAMSAEANLQNAVKRSGIVASIYATQSAGMLLQGNIAQATELINSALESAYEPFRREMEMTKFFLERNDKQLTASQSRLAGLELKQIDVAQREIEQASIDVTAAVATGYATAEEVKQMSELTGNPKKQTDLSRQILARSSRAQVAREDAQVAASQSAASFSQRKTAFDLAERGDPAAIAFLGFDPRATNMSLQDTFNYTNETAQFDRIINNLDKSLENEGALQASTGVSRSSLLSASARFGGPSLIAGGAAGSVVPIVGTAIGSFAGFVGGTALGTVQIANQKKELLGALSSLSNTAAFEKLREFREAGISFGQLTEAERIAIGRSAADLFAVLEIADDGTVSGINTSQEDFTRLNKAYREETIRKKDQARQIHSGLNPADEDLINSL